MIHRQSKSCCCTCCRAVCCNRGGRIVPAFEMLQELAMRHCQHSLIVPLKQPCISRINQTSAKVRGPMTTCNGQCLTQLKHSRSGVPVSRHAPSWFNLTMMFTFHSCISHVYGHAVTVSTDFTCMGHISIMAHLMVPSFLLLWGWVWRWHSSCRVNTAFTASSYAACASLSPPAHHWL